MLGFYIHKIIKLEILLSVRLHRIHGTKKKNEPEWLKIEERERDIIDIYEKLYKMNELHGKFVSGDNKFVIIWTSLQSNIILKK